MRRLPEPAPGTSYGLLKIVRGHHEKDRHGRWRGLCQCSCGSPLKTILLLHLRSGATTSCGCIVKEVARRASVTHGHAGHKTRSLTYISWRAMIQRCHDAKARSYPYYGARGITVCDRWRNDFTAFLADVGERPSKDHSIERLDSNGNYDVGLTRWADRYEQANNKSNNRRVERDGIVKTVAQWSRELSVSRVAIYGRVARGASENDTFAHGNLNRRRREQAWGLALLSHLATVGTADVPSIASAIGRSRRQASNNICYLLRLGQLRTVRRGVYTLAAGMHG